jgi:hypothetical protein
VWEIWWRGTRRLRPEAVVLWESDEMKRSFWFAKLIEQASLMKAMKFRSTLCTQSYAVTAAWSSINGIVNV